MAHKHSVYDTDLHFKIDNVTRNITSESGKVILMQNDHNSERFTFEIPRFVDGHDMSECNLVEVHYINTDSANKRNQMKDVYPITDLQISPDSDDVVIGSWLISQNATTYAGTLHFLIRYACIAGDFTVDYQWFTNIYSVISIAKGIYNTDVVTDEGDSDVLAAWKAEVLALAAPYVESAHASADRAAIAKENAMVSEANAAESEQKAKASEANAAESEQKAKASEERAVLAEVRAQSSEERAIMAETNAKVSEDIAATAVTRIQSMNTQTLDTLKELEQSVVEYEKKVGSTTFSVNFETGELEYDSPTYVFKINQETGNLEWFVDDSAPDATTTTTMITPVWSYGTRIDKTTGEETFVNYEGSTDGYAASQPIFFEKDSTYIFMCSNSLNTNAGMCFYDSDDNYMGYVEYIVATPYNKSSSVVVRQINNAAYMRMRMSCTLSGSVTLASVLERYSISKTTVESSNAGLHFATNESVSGMRLETEGNVIKLVYNGEVISSCELQNGN